MSIEQLCINSLNYLHNYPIDESVVGEFEMVGGNSKYLDEVSHFVSKIKHLKEDDEIIIDLVKPVGFISVVRENHHYTVTLATDRSKSKTIILDKLNEAIIYVTKILKEQISFGRKNETYLQEKKIFISKKTSTMYPLGFDVKKLMGLDTGLKDIVKPDIVEPAAQETNRLVHYKFKPDNKNSRLVQTTSKSSPYVKEITNSNDPWREIGLDIYRLLPYQQGGKSILVNPKGCNYSYEIYKDGRTYMLSITDYSDKTTLSWPVVSLVDLKTIMHKLDNYRTFNKAVDFLDSIR